MVNRDQIERRGRWVTRLLALCYAALAILPIAIKAGALPSWLD